METYGTSLVRLYNIAAKRYIAINHRGVVISEVCMTLLLHRNHDNVHEFNEQHHMILYFSSLI
jgi:hypothetical protein